MDVALQSRAEQFAGEIADQARTMEDLNELMRRMMKSALERMLNTEMDVHLGRRSRPDGGDAKFLAESSSPDRRRRRRKLRNARRTAATAVRGRRCKATWAS